MDGRISLAELQQAVSTSPVTPRAVTNSPVTPRLVPNSSVTPRAVPDSPAAGTEALFAAADMDKIGAIDFTKFTAVMLDSSMLAR